MESFKLTITEIINVNLSQAFEIILKFRLDIKSYAVRFQRNKTFRRLIQSQTHLGAASTGPREINHGILSGNFLPLK